MLSCSLVLSGEHRLSMIKVWTVDLHVHSITDTFATTRSVLIRGVSSFQRLFCTHLHLVDTIDNIRVSWSLIYKDVPLYVEGG